MLSALFLAARLLAAPAEPECTEDQDPIEAQCWDRESEEAEAPGED